MKETKVKIEFSLDDYMELMHEIEGVCDIEYKELMKAYGNDDNAKIISKSKVLDKLYAIHHKISTTKVFVTEEK